MSHWRDIKNRQLGNNTDHMYISLTLIDGTPGIPDMPRMALATWPSAWKFLRPLPCVALQPLMGIYLPIRMEILLIFLLSAFPTEFFLAQKPNVNPTKHLTLETWTLVTHACTRRTHSYTPHMQPCFTPHILAAPTIPCFSQRWVKSERMGFV